MLACVCVRVCVCYPPQEIVGGIVVIIFAVAVIQPWFFGREVGLTVHTYYSLQWGGVECCEVGCGIVGYCEVGVVWWFV